MKYYGLQQGYSNIGPEARAKEKYFVSEYRPRLKKKSLHENSQNIKKKKGQRKKHNLALTPEL